MRLMLAAALAMWGFAVAPTPPAGAVPGICPPTCDAIPDSAWIASTAVPLYPVYHWPGLAGLAVTAPDPRFAFERACAGPPVVGDPVSPSITTAEPRRVAAVISVAGHRVMHQYLVAHPRSSTVVELAMWSTLPPRVAWPAVPDAEVMDAMTAPLCEAYLGSCR